MLYYSTYIYIYIYLKPRKNISFLSQNPTFWYSGIFCEMHVLLLLVYLGIPILRKWRTYNKHFKWKQYLSCTMISYQVITQSKEDHFTLDRSPEFCIKHLIYYPGIQFRLPCTPRTSFHGCQIVHWDPLDAKRRCPKKFGLGYVKSHGFYGNP